MTASGLLVRVIPAAELSDRDVARWAELQDADPAFAAPYLSPDFTMRVAEVWPKIAVAIIESEGRQAGFFPYQDLGGSAIPVGRKLNHAAGIVAGPGLNLALPGLLRDCGLRAYRFAMLPESQRAFAPYRRQLWKAPFVDVSGGTEAFIARHKERHGKDGWASRGRLARKIEREIGPLSFSYDTDAPDAFEGIVALKLAQFRHHNNLADPRHLALLRHLQRTPSARCRVVVSALRAGGRLIAGQISIASPTVLGQIVVSYDPAVRRYSPGHLSMQRVCEAAAAAGIAIHDLSGGEQDWKNEWLTGLDYLADGFVAAGPLTAARLAVRAEYERRSYHLLNDGALGPGRRAGRALRGARALVDARRGPGAG